MAKKKKGELRSVFSKPDEGSGQDEIDTGATHENTIDEVPSSRDERERTDYLVVHCSATPASLDIGFKEIDDWHRGRGWKGCGYHRIIRRDGTLEDGRDLGAIGAHCYGYNRVSVGVCMVGGVSDDGRATANFTSPQLLSLRDLLRDLQVRYPEAAIVGHRDLSKDVNGDGIIDEHDWLKLCPSCDITELMQALKL